MCVCVCVCVVSSPNFHRLHLTSPHILICFDMQDVTLSYERIICLIVLVHFLVNLCPHYFATDRKKDPRPKWTKYKRTYFNYETQKSIIFRNKNCLSVGNYGILSIFVVICTVFRKSKVLMSDFLFSRLFVWVGRKHCLMSEKNITRMNGICVW